MRIDPDTSIHDLTDAEAIDLRALCEAMMRGPTPMDHPLFAAWSKASGLDDRQSLLAFTTAFLPRALHALLRRAEHGEPLRMIGDGSLVRLTITTPDEWKDPLP